MGDNYEQLVLRISESAKISVDDIERRVEAKRAKLSGLVSKEGAAQIVAAELGINFDQERMKIAQLLQGMRKVNVIGKIIEVFPIAEYNKNGRSGKVCSFRLGDDSSNTRVVLWDNHHISLIEEDKIGKGSFVEISNASVRNGEIHLSSFSDIKKSKEELKNVVEGKVFNYKKLSDAKAGDNFTTRAVVVQVFDPKYFEVCPECGKKVSGGKCAVHGEVKGKKRAILNIVLDDGNESIRGVLFGENINKLGLNDEEIFSLELFSGKKKELLGEEKFFSGNMRSNQIYNTNEFNIDGMDEIDTQKLIKELENR